MDGACRTWRRLDALLYAAVREHTCAAYAATGTLRCLNTRDAAYAHTAAPARSGSSAMDRATERRAHYAHKLHARLPRGS